MQNIIIMGVASCGKSTIGAALGEKTERVFLDGVSLHPASNIEKMSAGIPLTDADRWPWLASVGNAFGRNQTRIIACSALKKSYRNHIRKAAGADVVFIHLTGSRALLEKRMKSRTGHFMPMSLLDSQLATLEPLANDETGIEVSIDADCQNIVRTVIKYLKSIQSQQVL